jgi:hypothetical protein
MSKQTPVVPFFSAVDFAEASRQPVLSPLVESISAGRYGTAIYLPCSVSDTLNIRIEQLAAVTLACTEGDYFNDTASEALRHLAFDLAQLVAALRTVECCGPRFQLGGAKP